MKMIARIFNQFRTILNQCNPLICGNQRSGVGWRARRGGLIVNACYKYSDITEKIIGCAMKVHRVLGNGFQEVIYQRALAIEMNYDGLLFEREKEMGVFYRGEQIGTRRVD